MCEVFGLTVFAGITRGALGLLIQARGVAVGSPWARHPVGPGTLGAVEPCGTDHPHTDGLITVIACGTHVALFCVGGWCLKNKE